MFARHQCRIPKTSPSILLGSRLVFFLEEFMNSTLRLMVPGLLLTLTVAFVGCNRALPTVAPVAKAAAPNHAVITNDENVAQAPSGKSDSSLFGGTPQRNMVNTIDKNTPTTWNVEEGKQKNIKWIAELGNHAYGGPVIADGKIYVGTTNSKPRDPKVKGPKAVLMAFQESDGKFLWQIAHDIPSPQITSMDALSEGLCSTPVVDGKLLYYMAPGCEVICADTTGKIVWSYDLNMQLKVFPFHLGNCSPLVVGDLVMVITGNGRDDAGELRSPKAPSFVALNKTTGKLAWQSDLPGTKIIAGQFSNPTLATVNGKQQVIFAGGDCVLYALEPTTGNLIWKCDCLPQRLQPGARGSDNYIVATPVVVGDRLYVGLGFAPDTGASTPASYVLCLDITKKGDVSFKSYNAKDAVNKDSALVWAYGGLIDPPPAKGRRARFGATISTACVHDGLAFIPEESGYLHCLDAKTGQRYWDFDFKTTVWSSAYYVDGKVYVGTNDGDVFIFAHDKERKSYVKGTLQAPGKGDSAAASMDEAIDSTPVVANGVLYIATKSKLYAIK
jgi:outer membrane protein assembly factor BamB